MSIEFYFSILGLSTWAENIIVPLAVGMKPFSHMMNQLYKAKDQSRRNEKEHTMDLQLKKKKRDLSIGTYHRLIKKNPYFKLHKLVRRSKNGLFVEKPSHQRVAQLKSHHF